MEFSQKGYRFPLSFRRRINIATSVKGVKTFDVTVESDNSTMEALLTESDRLVAELDKRYPPDNRGGAV